MKTPLRFSLGLIISLSLSLFGQTAFAAYTGDLDINDSTITFSHYNFLEGYTTRIYASVSNKSSKDLLGVVRFFDNDKQVNGDQAISLFAGKTDDVFIDWTPLSPGLHKLAVKIFPYQPELDDPSNNWVVKEVTVLQDTDHDGIQNSEDPDDDNDGTPDETDLFPLNNKESKDTDGDGKGDNADTDDDNDGVPDNFDDLPLDPNETIDTDHDGIGNIADTDDDGDGISDAEEEKSGTDPLNSDSDADTFNDGTDAFPLDKNEQLDTDKDKIGNNIDTDDDNDGLTDDTDPFPLNKEPVIKLDDNDSTVGLLEKHVFDASPSFDDDGEIVSYLWNIDGENFEGNSITHIFDKPGKHKIKLTITDDSGQSATSDFQINVINLRLYTSLTVTLIVILLALLIYFKYIAPAKKQK